MSYSITRYTGPEDLKYSWCFAVIAEIKVMVKDSAGDLKTIHGRI